LLCISSYYWHPRFSFPKFAALIMELTAVPLVERGSLS
jgi:hypothetical protein